MARLILSMDGLVLKEIPLTKERTTIGRKPHNDIQIDNLAVSGEHAVIVTILNDSFLEDLGSTNGTLVNGQAIKKHFLQNNDVIELGKYRLKYISEAGQQPVPSTADFERTMVLRPSAVRQVAEQARALGTTGGLGTTDGLGATGGLGSTGGQAASAAEAIRNAAAQEATNAAAAAGTVEKQTPPPPPPPAQKAAQPLGAIQIISGSNAGKELELVKPLTTLGKPGVQVAVLTRRPHGYYITHVEGANFPVVNGQPIASAPHALKEHDLIELAGVKMEFFLKA